MFETAKQIRLDTRQVKAVLDGTMSETRQPIKLPNWVTVEDKELGKFFFATGKHGDGDSGIIGADELISYLNLAPYQVGDILYVRETWCKLYALDDNENFIEGTEKYYYRAGEEPPFNRYLKDDGNYSDFPIWRPSIHMPKEAARIFLRVTDVTVERVRDITEEGAIAEGVSNKELEYIAYSGKPEFEKPMDKPIEIEQFKILWDSVYAKRGYGWDENPWVRVTKFERLEA